MKIIAVVATRNEPRIREFVLEVRRYVDDVICADESTSSFCREEIGLSGAVLLPCQGGIGPSLVAGWRKALSMGADLIVQIDAGGSHSPRDIPRVMFPVMVGQADVVVGSRFTGGATYRGRRWRAWCSRLYAWLHRWYSARPGTDWTSGFRCFTRRAAKLLARQPYEVTMHGWQAEVLHRAHDLELRVIEAPINYQAGSSALKVAHVKEAMRVR